MEAIEMQPHMAPTHLLVSVATVFVLGFSLLGCQHGIPSHGPGLDTTQSDSVHMEFVFEDERPRRFDGSRVRYDFPGQFPLRAGILTVLDHAGYPLPYIPYTIRTVDPEGWSVAVREGKSDIGGDIDTNGIAIPPGHRLRVHVSPKTIYSPTRLYMRPGVGVTVKLAPGRQSVRGQIIILSSNEVELIGPEGPTTGRLLRDMIVELNVFPAGPAAGRDNLVEGVDWYPMILTLRTDESGFFETTQLPDNAQYSMTISYHSQWMEQTFSGHTLTSFPVCDCVGRYIFTTGESPIGWPPILKLVRRECGCGVAEEDE
ncbi:MAG: hypothetical protein JJU36_15830 [Phycisphaeraceae bacterium]|nr:hypothetical protein [Phycisphaeraceae bacterium]